MILNIGLICFSFSFNRQTFTATKSNLVSLLRIKYLHHNSAFSNDSVFRIQTELSYNIERKIYYSLSFT